jgi:hypothetical protein
MVPAMQLAGYQWRQFLHLFCVRLVTDSKAGRLTVLAQSNIPCQYYTIIGIFALLRRVLDWDMKFGSLPIAVYG